MLKLLRKGAIENMWFYRIIMIILSLAFVITMGWWGFGGPQEQRVVAKVGNVSITLDQYQQAYERAYKTYRDLFKDEFNEDLIKQLNLKRTVIDGLVERQLWLFAAQQTGVRVSDREVSDSILKEQAFQRQGKFDLEVYKRVLTRIGFTPETFEELQREELAVEKVRALLKDSVSVTDIELQELQAQQAANPQASATSASQEQLQGLLMRKQQMALETYLNHLKAEIPITIEEKLL